MKFNVGDVCYYIGRRYQVIGFSIEDSQTRYKIIRFDYRNPSTEPEIVLESNPNLLTPSEWREKEKFIDLQKIRAEYTNMIERRGEDFANRQLKFLLADYKLRYGEDLTDVLLPNNAILESMKINLNKAYGVPSETDYWPMLKSIQDDIRITESLKRKYKTLIEGAKKSMNEEKETSKKMSITINEEKQIVTVAFPNGKVAMSRCSKDDKFDPYVGAALCIAAELFGSKTKFKKYVDEHGKKVKTKKEK